MSPKEQAVLPILLNKMPENTHFEPKIEIQHPGSQGWKIFFEPDIRGYSPLSENWHHVCNKTMAVPGEQGYADRSHCKR